MAILSLRIRLVTLYLYPFILAGIRQCESCINPNTHTFKGEPDGFDLCLVL